ncbi:MAG: penicillin-insensitive murein endopeptidase [Deltaproteobacteria bacterium]|nr:penicillin-insensitive murein endopeptidase [Deltaproteobacteria bacterium]
MRASPDHRSPPLSGFAPRRACLWPSIALALLCTATLAACGGPPQQRRKTVSKMVFVDDGEVEDDAVEPAVRDRRRIPRPPPRSRPQERSEPKRAARSSDDGLQARCANGDVDGHSVGRATDGSLDDGCELPRSGPGYRCSHHARFGARKIVAILQWAAGELHRLHPSAPPVVVGALSREGGGKLKGHKSHQSGRDIDVGYLHEDGALSRFVQMSAADLDIERTWTLLGAMLHTGQVQYIFMDYRLQAALHRYLEREGVDDATLGRIFQYPHGRGARRGIIRHASGHADHFHVRFRCPAEDEDCED